MTFRESRAERSERLRAWAHVHAERDAELREGATESEVTLHAARAALVAIRAGDPPPDGLTEDEILTWRADSIGDALDLCGLLLEDHLPA